MEVCLKPVVLSGWFDGEQCQLEVVTCMLSANTYVRGEHVMIKIVDSIHYHLWSDALHGRELARQAKNDWDRGTYVRWTVQTAWTAFEAVCGDTLGVTGLGMRFRERFDEAIAKMGLPPVNWGQGVWQQVLAVYGVRKEFIHIAPTVSQARLMTPTAEAESAIAVLRNGIREVCNLVNVPHPPWVADDADPGFDKGGGTGAHATLIQAGAKEGDPEVIRIAYVYRGKEHVCDVMPPGTDHRPVLDALIPRFNVPVSAVRAYRGNELLEERKLLARRA